MVNNEAFAKRIKKIILFYGISAAQLADKIGVQRSSISHLLSGRNKPSLDFVMKIVKAYDAIDLYWLLNGKGRFPKLDKSETAILEASEEIKKPQSDLVLSEASPPPEGAVEHIIVFYKNGTFKKYKAV